MAGDGSPPRVSATLSELLATGGGGHSSAAWTCAEPTPEAWEWRGSSLEFGLLEALGLPPSDIGEAPEAAPATEAPPFAAPPTSNSAEKALDRMGDDAFAAKPAPASPKSAATLPPTVPLSPKSSAPKLPPTMPPSMVSDDSFGALDNFGSPPVPAPTLQPGGSDDFGGFGDFGAPPAAAAAATSSGGDDFGGFGSFDAPPPSGGSMGGADAFGGGMGGGGMGGGGMLDDAFGAFGSEASAPPAAAPNAMLADDPFGVMMPSSAPAAPPPAAAAVPPPGAMMGGDDLMAMFGGPPAPAVTPPPPAPPKPAADDAFGDFGDDAFSNFGAPPQMDAALGGDALGVPAPPPTTNDFDSFASAPPPPKEDPYVAWVATLPDLLWVLSEELIMPTGGGMPIPTGGALPMPTGGGGGMSLPMPSGGGLPVPTGGGLGALAAPPPAAASFGGFEAGFGAAPATSKPLDMDFGGFGGFE